ncbi:BTB/POZ domain [Popillia japonica]|uniref:BTB/POZ domain n=1 Tax=Popillia japonica TaxID=7064 RepID=A0AAW1N389_POPJA
MSTTDDQQFCLRWNNFQANITSQFETLRDDEDFTDVTIACEGQRLQAHKVVLSACSPFFKELFKELFKSNPCPHPIIFMRDVEAQHIVALMEFMYAGEVNVAQAHLSTFLKTAESLKIRGLTDTSASGEHSKEKDEGTIFTNSKPSSSKGLSPSYITKQRFKSQISSTSTVTSSQDVPASSEKPGSPPPKRHCKNEHIETELSSVRDILPEETLMANHLVGHPDYKNNGGDISKSPIHPKVELPDYLSDDDRDDAVVFFNSPEASELPGGMEIIPQTPGNFLKETGLESNIGTDGKKLHSLDPRPCEECGRVYSNLSNLRQHMKLIHYPTYVQCPICQKDFKTDLYLRRHMLGSHEINKVGGEDRYWLKAL